MYRFEARYVGRSQGKSSTKQAAHNAGKRTNAVASAAYLSRSAITDNRTGQVWDYSRHFGGAHSEVILPPNAPAWMADRAKLWNQVEKIENRKDSMLAHDFIITMDWKLTRDQQWAAVRQFVQQEIVGNGKPADVGMHIYGERWNASAKKTAEKVANWKTRGYPFCELKDAPTKAAGPHVAIERAKNGNIKGYYLFQPHIHVMTPFRTVDPDSGTGFSKNKETVTQGHWKFEAPKQLERYRTAWAQIGADALEAAGHPIEAARFRVGHLTIVKQREEALARGDKDWAVRLDRLPEPKKGPIAAKMEREDRGHEANAIRDWQDIKDVNCLKQRMAGRKAEIILLRERIPRMEPQLSLQGQKRAIEEATKDQAVEITAMKERKAEIDELIAQIDHDRRHAEEEKQKEAAGRTIDADIKSPRERYLDALGQHRGSHNTFDLLLSAARIEASDIGREHDKLTMNAHNAKDPNQKIDILLVRDVQFYEHMASVEERLSHYSRFNEGRHPRRELDFNDNPMPLASELHEQKARDYSEEAVRLRQELRDRRELVEDRLLSSLSDRIDTPQPERGAERGDRYRPLNEQHDRIDDLQTRQVNLDERRQQSEATWRTVSNDEVLQPGAHVRMDIETGKTEVREAPLHQANEYPDSRGRDLEEHTGGRGEVTDAKAEVGSRRAQAYREADRELANEQQHDRDGDWGRE